MTKKKRKFPTLRYERIICDCKEKKLLRHYAKELFALVLLRHYAKELFAFTSLTA